MIPYNISVQPITDVLTSDSFQSLGALAAFILVMLQIVEYFKKKIKLGIELNQKHFTSKVHGYGYTSVEIKAEIVNNGIKSTKITSVMFNSKIKEINNVSLMNEVNNLSGDLSCSFEPVVIEPGHREEFILYFKKDDFVLPDSIKKVKATIVFKADREYKEKIKLLRDSSE